MSMPASLLLRKIKRLEDQLAACKGSSMPSNNLSALNTSSVAIHIPSNAIEALADLKSEIQKSSCKNSVVIQEKLSFLNAKVGGYKTRSKRSKKSKKSKKTRKQ